MNARIIDPLAILLNPGVLVGRQIEIEVGTVGFDVEPMRPCPERKTVLIENVNPRPFFVHQRHFDRFGPQEFFIYVRGVDTTAPYNRHIEICLVPASVIYVCEE